MKSNGCEASTNIPVERETNKQTDQLLHVSDGDPDSVATSNYRDESTEQPVNIIHVRPTESPLSSD